MKNRNDSILLGAIVLSGVSISAAILIGPDSDVWTASTAAWVQAIGSIIAIGVAIAVPAYMRQSEKAMAVADRKLRARSLAIQIEPYLHRYRLNTVRLKSLEDPWPEASGPLVIALITLDDDLFDDTPELVNALPQLHILGEPICLAVQRALTRIGACRNYQSIIKKTVDPQEFARDHMDTIMKLITSADGALETALARVKEFDAYWQ